MRTDCHEHRIVLGTDLLNGNIISDGHIRLDAKARKLHSLNLMVQYLSRQTISGDAVPEHSSQPLSLFENRHLMPHDAEVVCAAQAAGTASDDRYLFPCCGHPQRRLNLSLVFHGKTL